jgi:hypothetical protein
VNLGLDLLTMTRTHPEFVLLDAQQCDFLGGPVAINVASRTAALLPSIARAYGCRVGNDRTQVVIFLSLPRSQAVVRDLSQGAPVAAIFSRPKTHKSLQLKGERADVLPLSPGDREIMRAYRAAFSDEICGLGYSDAFVRALVAGVDEEAVGVRFRVSSAFEQTPGPHAGERLGAKA